MATCLLVHADNSYALIVRHRNVNSKEIVFIFHMIVLGLHADDRFGLGRKRSPAESSSRFMVETQSCHSFEIVFRLVARVSKGRFPARCLRVCRPSYDSDHKEPSCQASDAAKGADAGSPTCSSVRSVVVGFVALPAWPRTTFGTCAPKQRRSVQRGPSGADAEPSVRQTVMFRWASRSR